MLEDSASTLSINCNHCPISNKTHLLSNKTHLLSNKTHLLRNKTDTILNFIEKRVLENNIFKTTVYKNVRIPCCIRKVGIYIESS